MLSHYSLDSSLAGVIDGRGGSSGGGRLGGTSPLPVPPRPTPGGGGEFTGIRLASDWPGRVKPEGPAELVRGVARVVVQTTGEQLATGTGFAINPGGVFLTCHHVVEDAAAVGVVFDGNTEVRPVEVLASDPHGDVAVLRISDGHGAEHWLQLADVDDEPKLGQDLGLLGYPLGEVGLEVTYSQGVVNSLRSTSTHKILQIDAGAAPGSSGGPVFRREDGRVIGILGSGLQGRAGMLANFAMDIRQIWALGWVPQ
jgi:S1-C subfamily serine protease